MKKNILMTLLAIAMISAPINTYAEEETSYTMTFLDFDGKVMQTLEVKAGEKIDYTQIDTSSLHTHPDIYTEQAFYTWSATPDTINENTTVQALYKKATIHIEGSPTKTEYYTAKGDIKLDGLSVFITLDIQTPVKDQNDDYYITSQSENITSSCYAEISSLEEIFADGKTASVNVMPPGDNKPVLTYEITLFNELGDITGDGLVDSIDATFILQTYANISTGENLPLNEKQTKICDINKDSFIDALDATYVLIYYAEASTNGSPVWEEIVPALA